MFNAQSLGNLSFLLQKEEKTDKMFWFFNDFTRYLRYAKIN